MRERDCNPSETVRRLNPGVFRPGVNTINVPAEAPAAKPGKRIRQSSKPLLNKLEQEWFDHLTSRVTGWRIRKQAISLKLANGATYRPDLFTLDTAEPTAWECKGPKQVKGCSKGLMTLKIAAHEYPEIRFVLVWKEDGEWKQQEVLP